MKRKFLLAGLILVISLVWAGANAQTNIVTNGNFEGGFTANADDQIPNGWTKLETSEPPENSTIWWANDNGPTLAGSKSLDWVRWNGSMSGDWTACEQTLNYNVAGCATLTLTIDVKAFSHNLGGSGWTPEDWEYPVTIVVYYTDTQGIQRYWQWGWCLWVDQQTGPLPDHKQVSGNGVVTGQLIPQANVWVANSYNLLTELINPATINKIRVGGSGWDFEGRADNVQILCQKGWYWKPAFEDYAPSGMPDFDQKQDNWVNPTTLQWSFCGPTALANCWWWFDSKYNIPPGVPGDANDMFPLVRDYLDNLNAFVGRDDHDPWNVNHANTPWFPGVPPPATAQPFIPGPQTPGGGLAPWGELVERLAWYVDCDGRRTGNAVAGTHVDSMQAGIDRWLLSETFDDGTTLADVLYERTIQKPTFAQVESLVEMCEDVILLLGFWYFGAGEQQFIRGDINEDGVVNMNDLTDCFYPPFSCDDAGDVNDDGVLDTMDCQYLRNYLFFGGPPPPPPFPPPMPGCGYDPTPDQLGCAHFPPCPTGPSEWYRVGGHYVTVAGVCSDSFKIAFSDPCIDWAEQGFPGRIGSGTLIPHLYPHTDPTIHNDAGNVSHDIYAVTLTSPSPGGLWGIPDYPASMYPIDWMYIFQSQNIPNEFLSQTRPWNGMDPVYTEVEYAVVVSPKNRPPKIIQPDTLHGYQVGDTVIYTFDGIDPDGDVIQDQASLVIDPSCGNYSVQRIAGQGTSNGTWQVTWLTAGCQASITYKIIVDLTDTLNNTSYCTTYVYLSPVPRECDPNDPKQCDTLWVECGNMRVPPGGGLAKVDLTIANDESLMAIVVPLSYKGSPVSCDSMPDSENTAAKVFAGSIVPGGWIKGVTIDHTAKTVIVYAIAMTPPTDCLTLGKGHFATLTLFGDSCCTIQLDTTAWTGATQDHIGFIECNDPSMTLFYPVCRIDTCHIDRNNPPVIDQPDSLEGYVDDQVSYTFSGSDPDGDVIRDSASLSIVPSCGTYSVTRISGQGTSSGTWQVNWQTSGCQDSITYLVIVDLRDVLGATSYCTTKVHLSQAWPDHKMHYPQLPDPEGWDIVSTMGYEMHPGMVTADDFMCMKSGPITGIHFWGSWLYDMQGPIAGFFLSIHENIPGPPSMPGAALWGTGVTDFEVTLEGQGEQGWYDPNTFWWEHPNHSLYYRYDIDSIPEPFYQDSGTIYWLSIMADIGPPGYQGIPVPEPPLWGWKTSRSPHFQDDAVWSPWLPPGYAWQPLEDPRTGITLDMAFVITSTGQPVLCGDMNNNGMINLGDIVYLITYVYKGGPAPVPLLCVGDVNHDGIVGLGDVVYMITYVYKGGPPPNPNCCNPPWVSE
jgi:putative component of membrane protein insertase Oxa1/YidC/SpoIIIJ protein YidD